MRKVIFLFLSSTFVFTVFNCTKTSLTPVLADSSQSSRDSVNQVSHFNKANLPSKGNPNSGFAEKGKLIREHNSIICPQSLKNNQYITVSSKNTQQEGKGQFSPACLHQAK